MQTLIDPGHGGPEHRGAVKGDFIEAVYNLDLAHLLAESMDAWGFPTAMTRLGDITMPLSDRGEYGAMWGADFTICLHVNSHFDSSLRGLMTFVLPGDRKAYDAASAIQCATPHALYRKRGTPYVASQYNWTKGAYNVLTPHVRQSPVLIEVGFASNDYDRNFLVSKLGRLSIVAALLAGICRAASHDSVA